MERTTSEPAAAQILSISVESGTKPFALWKGIQENEQISNKFKISMKREKLTLAEKRMELHRRRRRSGSSCRLLTLHAFHNPLDMIEGWRRLALSLGVVEGRTETSVSCAGVRDRVQSRIPGCLR
jgi:hypothetical protein